MSDKPKIAIIGMGFLMSYLKPCYHHILGDNLQNNIVASTATAETTKRKSEAMGFPVQCQDYFNMLVNFEPDIIFFSPPPSAAKSMAKDILTPYYSGLRNKEMQLPDLYAFPPSPDGKFYIDTIGNDINVVNILPNMASSLKGRNIAKESYTIFNFPDGHPWPKNNYERLVDFFSPIGYTLTVPAKQFSTMLGGFVGSHISEELAIAISTGISLSNNGKVSFSEIAGSMRYSFLKNNSRCIENSLPCSLIGVSSLDSILNKIISEWTNGMLSFYISENMEESLGKNILIPQIDIFLQSAQLLTESEIEYNNSCHATKGGLLEKALFYYDTNIKDKLISTFSHYPEENFDEGLYGFIFDSGFEIAKAVSDHGKRFSD